MELATRVVHQGRPERASDRSLNVPLTMASVFEAGGDYEYGRGGNPTWSAFEEALGSLEGGQCLASTSGVAAAHLILGQQHSSLGRSVRVVVGRHCYGGTLALLEEFRDHGLVELTSVDLTDADAVAVACAGADILWLESPSNPALELCDLGHYIALAHQNLAVAVVDNTFATPLRQQPLSLGADIVIHSATKYISGHSDVLLGAIITADQSLYEQLSSRRSLIGAIPGTLECWLALRGMRTLAVRLDRAEANARELARRLAEHPAIDEARYPGFGAIVSIVTASDSTARALPAHTKIWTHATSLGGVDSTLERRRRWDGEPTTIPANLVRLSVGIEDVEDLWRDLEQALQAS